MRILMLAQGYPPFIGGETLHVQSLSITLASHGHEVAVVTLWQPGLAPFEVDQGVRVYRVRSSSRRISWLYSDPGRRRAPTFPDPEVMLALRRIIKQERPEIVHAHNWLVYSFLPLKTWSGARLVVTLHNYNLVCAKMSLQHEETQCTGPELLKCLRCAAQFYGSLKGTSIVLSNRIMSLIEQGLVDVFLPNSHATATGNGLVGSHLPFQVIHHFIPDDFGTGDADPYLAQLPNEDFLLYVGALSRHKGVDVLLHAYAGITNAPPLVIIGYPTPEWQTINEICPDNVIVLTNWPRFAIIEAWRRCIMAIVPSVWAEPFGMVILEAMSTGCPVIASRTGGIIDLIDDGETGLLTQAGDAQSLQQAIEQLLADSDLRKRMGASALHKVREFRANVVVPRFENVYRELLQSKTASSQNAGLHGSSIGTTRI